MTTTKKPDLYLYFQMQDIRPDTIDAGRQVSEMELTLIKRRDDYSPQWFSDNLSSESAYSGLRLHCYLCSSHNPNPVYGIETQYYDRRYLDLYDLERMIKLLRAITRKLEKLNDNEGYAQGFSEHAVRFAKAVGAVGYCRTNDNRLDGRQYRWGTIGDLRTHIDHKIRNFVTTTTKTEAA